MSNQVALTGSDTVILNNRLLTSFADNDVANLTFPNDIMTVKTGKNGNSLYTFNTTGRQCDFNLRILRGSVDDKFLNGLLLQMINDPASFPLMIGEFIKRVGNGQSVVTTDTYVLSGGVFVRQVDGKENADGDTETAIALYRIRFTNSPRSLT
jgi:hypothetical protein